MNPRINAFQSDAGLLSCDQCYISLVTSDYCHVAIHVYSKRPMHLIADQNPDVYYNNILINEQDQIVKAT